MYGAAEFMLREGAVSATPGLDIGQTRVFLPDGGKVVVRSRVLSDSVVLMIADTGIGIAPHSLLRLGRPFEQVESQLTKTYHGSGLGLAIARSLTNLHGGSMRLRSKLGTGTVVCVSLPRDARKAKAKISVAA